jgi:hypothetical protein
MLPLNKKNDTIIGVLASAGVVLAGIAALLTYIHTKEHRKLSKKNAQLELEIKELQLLKLKHDVDGMN